MNPWLRNLLCGGGGGGGGVVLPPAGRTFLMSKSSLILDEGAGNPTWSRATKAWGFNELGYLTEIASGCAFFGGARLVRNLVPTPSNTLAVAGTKTVTLTQAATLQFSMGAGAGTATFSGTGGATGTLAAGASRVSVNKTVTAGTFIVTASVDALVDLSIVDVTNYDASYVPEYVSVGVLSSPYHGAGTTSTADGCKYFETDWQGAPIPAANLLGFRREAAATNPVWHSRDMRESVWTKSKSGIELVVDGQFDSGTSWTTGSGWTISGGVASKTAGVASNLVQSLPIVQGTMYAITLSYTTSAGSMYLRFGSTATNYGSFSGSGTQTFTLFPNGDSNIYIFGNASFVGSVDNISVQAVTVQPTKTATGIDGVANSASTLTATAADAIILQPITLASAARCASAYVKRRTGTGTISFTQDGGSTWTDITSQINSSTWSRVQITATLANPSVGFKISTLGDAIDVDVVQNEAGSVATSPIITTTATVTRNADSLTYQTASNWSNTAGTAFVEVAPLAYSGGAIGSATNGLLLSTSNSGATASDGTNSVNGPSGTPGSSEKLAFRWGSGAMTVSSGGVIGTPGIYDGSMDLTVIGIGSSAAGYFKNVAIYNYAMTDAELQAITA